MHLEAVLVWQAQGAFWDAVWSEDVDVSIINVLHMVRKVIKERIPLLLVLAGKTLAELLNDLNHVAPGSFLVETRLIRIGDTLCERRQ
eukprot:1818166-Pleurochrysis_carterae.AAC.1